MSLDGHAIHDPDAVPILTESLALAAAHCGWHKLRKKYPQLSEADWEAFRQDMKRGIEAGMSTQARGAQD